MNACVVFGFGLNPTVEVGRLPIGHGVLVPVELHAHGRTFSISIVNHPQYVFLRAIHLHQFVLETLCIHRVPGGQCLSRLLSNALLSGMSASLTSPDQTAVRSCLLSHYLRVCQIVCILHCFVALSTDRCQHKLLLAEINFSDFAVEIKATTLINAP